MNRLKERRVEIGLMQTDVSANLKAVESRIDAAMVSRYEKGVCLPTKAQMTALEKVLAADRTELYDPEDLDLMEIGPSMAASENAKTGGRPKKDQRSRQYYRKCFRISREFEESLPDDLLAVLGYASWQSWFDTQMRCMLAGYQAKKRRMKI